MEHGPTFLPETVHPVANLTGLHRLHRYPQLQLGAMQNDFARSEKERSPRHTEEYRRATSHLLTSASLSAMQGLPPHTLYTRASESECAASGHSESTG
jgi:hypothetical protein